ncbi:MAG: hypothetical protein QOD35_963 [Nocardioidaceae bacterium]|jgi:uncharacterized membrane-anchored protein|nr:hypothetical protein [Nocardioidaceae bacterium]
MKLSLLRRGRPPALSGTVGTARLDRRTRSVVKRVQPGDIAVIDHVDLDRTSAVALVEARVGAVVNVAPYVSGRYPNLGPEILLEAGVPIVDNVDPAIFTAVDDGDVIRVDGGRIYRDDRVVASGVPHDAESISTALVAARGGIPDQLDAFSVNAIEHLRQERALLLEGEGVPATSTVFDDRPALVVSRAFDYRTDLASLKTFIRENDPVLVGVDAGADALMQAGHRPTVIVTDLDDVSDAALRCGAEVVVHTASGDRANDADRLDRLNVRSTPFVTGGTTEDAAILLASTRGARLIVLAGSHATLPEFLDLGRSGMASSFLTRAAVGSRLLDARAVAQLYRHRVNGWLVLLLVLIGIGLVAAAVATTPVGQDWFTSVGDQLQNARSWVRARIG